MLHELHFLCNTISFPKSLPLINLFKCRGNFNIQFHKESSNQFKIFSTNYKKIVYSARANRCICRIVRSFVLPSDFYEVYYNDEYGRRMKEKSI